MFVIDRSRLCAAQSFISFLDLAEFRGFAAHIRMVFLHQRQPGLPDFGGSGAAANSQNLVGIPARGSALSGRAGLLIRPAELFFPSPALLLFAIPALAPLAVFAFALFALLPVEALKVVFGLPKAGLGKATAGWAEIKAALVSVVSGAASPVHI